jgi:hypothetical protein
LSSLQGSFLYIHFSCICHPLFLSFISTVGPSFPSPSWLPPPLPTGFPSHLPSTTALRRLRQHSPAPSLPRCHAELPRLPPSTPGAHQVHELLCSLGRRTSPPPAAGVLPGSSGGAPTLSLPPRRATSSLPPAPLRRRRGAPCKPTPGGCSSAEQGPLLPLPALSLLPRRPPLSPSPVLSYDPNSISQEKGRLLS